MNDYEQLKLCAARYIYRAGIIDDLLPSCARHNLEHPRRKPKKETWRDWWRDRFDEEFNDYVETVKNAKASANTK